jgi:hypothetical protein
VIAVSAVRRFTLLASPCVVLAFSPGVSLAGPEQESPVIFATGAWAGVLETPSGPSLTVVLALWDAPAADGSVGRAVYASPGSTCRYNLWLDEAGANSLTLTQRLHDEDGKCVESSRLVLRRAGAGRLSGDWFLTDGTHWMNARLDKPGSGYYVTLDGFRGRQANLSEKIRFEGLAEGEHTVELHGVPEECEVIGPNPRVIETEQGGTLETSFAVQCPGDPRVSATEPESDPLP